jgi:hypothetical protein
MKQYYSEEAWERHRQYGMSAEQFERAADFIDAAVAAGAPVVINVARPSRLLHDSLNRQIDPHLVPDQEA